MTITPYSWKCPQVMNFIFRLVINKSMMVPETPSPTTITTTPNHIVPLTPNTVSSPQMTTLKQFPP